MVQAFANIFFTQSPTPTAIAYCTKISAIAPPFGWEAKLCRETNFPPIPIIGLSIKK
jgi:hypothetical protein